MSVIRNETFIGGNMSNIMDDIRSGRGLPPLGDSVPMPDVKQPKNKIDFRVYYTLDESGLKKIVSKYFGTSSDRVSIKVVPTSVGYGKTEHEEYHVEVTVENYE